MTEDLPPEERYKGWGRRWEAPPMSYMQYVTVEIGQGAFPDGKSRYILIDGDGYSTACTFSTAPHGPLFTEEELKSRLEAFKYIGVERDLIDAEQERIFQAARDFSPQSSL